MKQDEDDEEEEEEETVKTQRQLETFNCCQICSSHRA